MGNERSEKSRAGVDRRRTSSTILREVEAARRDPKRRVGRFVILAELGRGGMGIVYRAWDDELRRVVAVKVTREKRSDERSLERFRREARAAAGLSHPGIVPVLEVGEHQGRPYFVMDHVEGRTLSELIRGGGLQGRELVRVIREVALALHHAHGEGIVHRDVKPSNVLVTPDGQALLADFGLARDKRTETRLTASAEVLGTVVYMAPEHLMSDVAPGREHAVDVWGLGIILYEGLCGGRVPFDGQDGPQVIAAVLSKQIEPPSAHAPALDPALEGVVLRCLRRDPAERYASAADLARDLERWLAGELPAGERIATSDASTIRLVDSSTAERLRCPRCARTVKDAACGACGIDLRTGEGLTVGEAARMMAVDPPSSDSNEVPVIFPEESDPDHSRREPERPGVGEAIVDVLVAPFASPAATALVAVVAGLIVQGLGDGTEGEAVAAAAGATLLAALAAVEHARAGAEAAVSARAPAGGARAAAPPGGPAAAPAARPMAPAALFGSFALSFPVGAVMTALGLGLRFGLVPGEGGAMDPGAVAGLVGALVVTVPAGVLVTVLLVSSDSWLGLFSPVVWAEVLNVLGAVIAVALGAVAAAAAGLGIVVLWQSDAAPGLVRGALAVAAAAFAGAAVGAMAGVVLHNMTPKVSLLDQSKRWRTGRGD